MIYKRGAGLLNDKRWLAKTIGFGSQLELAI